MNVRRLILIAAIANWWLACCHAGQVPEGTATWSPEKLRVYREFRDKAYAGDTNAIRKLSDVGLTINRDAFYGILFPGNIVPHSEQTNISGAQASNEALGVEFGKEVEGMRLGTALRRITNGSGIGVEATLVLQNVCTDEKYYLRYGEYEPYELFLLTPDSRLLALIATQQERRRRSFRMLDSKSISAGNQVVTKIVLPLGGGVTFAGDYNFLAVARIPKGRSQNEADLRVGRVFHLTPEELSQVRNLTPSNLPPFEILSHSPTNLSPLRLPLDATGGGAQTPKLVLREEIRFFVPQHVPLEIPKGSPHRAGHPWLPSGHASLVFLPMFTFGILIWLYWRHRSSTHC